VRVHDLFAFFINCEIQVRQAFFVKGVDEEDLDIKSFMKVFVVPISFVEILESGLLECVVGSREGLDLFQQLLEIGWNCRAVRVHDVFAFIINFEIQLRQTVHVKGVDGEDLVEEWKRWKDELPHSWSDDTTFFLEI
jgi:hypothetical protein